MRRKFITLLGGAAAWPVAARAQQGERMRRIGVLLGLAANDPDMQAWLPAFRQGLERLGMVGGTQCPHRHSLCARQRRSAYRHSLKSWSPCNQT